MFFKIVIIITIKLIIILVHSYKLHLANKTSVANATSVVVRGAVVETVALTISGLTTSSEVTAKHRFKELNKSQIVWDKHTDVLIPREPIETLLLVRLSDHFFSAIVSVNHLE